MQLSEEKRIDLIGKSAQLDFMLKALPAEDQAQVKQVEGEFREFLQSKGYFKDKKKLGWLSVIFGRVILEKELE